MSNKQHLLEKEKTTTSFKLSVWRKDCTIGEIAYQYASKFSMFSEYEKRYVCIIFCLFLKIVRPIMTWVWFSFSSRLQSSHTDFTHHLDIHPVECLPKRRKMQQLAAHKARQHVKHAQNMSMGFEVSLHWKVIM